ncbi:hypothetical protein ISS85_02125 [Candidatus Microgenomates bacterium]|nr:hypothetical protein [Candidatus Microgenomates bacterium]
MRIVICGSMTFAQEMINTAKKLEEKGHQVFFPPLAPEFVDGRRTKDCGGEDVSAKKHIDALNLFYQEIKKADAILVLNYTKRGIDNYIGANSLIEMAFAHVLGKKIFILNPTPQMDYSSEIIFMEPVVLNGDLGKVSQ